MQLSIGLLLVYVTAAYGWFLRGGSSSSPIWNDFRATFGLTPHDSESFVKQPLTVDEAKKDGWTQVSNTCQGKFLGQRFVKNKDIGFVLIYDSKGVIAGVQMGLPTLMVRTQDYKFSEQKMFNRDVIAGIDAYILTAYFVDPKTICQSTRGVKQVKNNDYGTGLWLQNGPDPVRDSFAVPLNQSDALKTKWVEGGCVPSMGVHYWYDNRLDSDCEVFFPCFLLYNKGKLAGFGWAAVGKYEYTKRTEYPPFRTLAAIFKPVPTCIPTKYNEAGGFTTLHMYFDAEPWNIFC